MEKLLSQMTLEEKVGMIHANSAFTSGGVERLGIPEWSLSDGPHGVRMEHARNWGGLVEGADDESTYLPVGIALASTWNTQLAYEFGVVLGKEARDRGKDVILGPGVDIIRTPLNGRNFEYFSEDPYLTGRIAVDYIKGVQGQDVAACAKHFIANNQETNRTSINVELSERALREIYLPVYQMAVERANVYTIMGAYNKVRGQHATHHEYLINGVLKGEFGFDGVLLSDWSAVQNTMEALLYGTDLEMGTDLRMLPNPDYSKFFMADTVITLVRNGVVDEAIVDDKVRRILRIMHRTNVFDARKQGARNTPEHKQLALRVAEEGIVLLKNDGILPLQKKNLKRIAVIGDNAVRKHATGGGSSQVRPLYEVTPLEGIKNFTGDSAEILFAQGYEVTRSGATNTTLLREAVEVASKSDVVILVGGFNHGFSDAWEDLAFDAESVDKKDIFLPFGQDELFQAVMRANPNTVVVLVSGSAVDMTAWEPSARGILFGVVRRAGRWQCTGQHPVWQGKPLGQAARYIPKKAYGSFGPCGGRIPWRWGNREVQGGYLCGLPVRHYQWRGAAIPIWARPVLHQI